MAEELGHLVQWRPPSFEHRPLQTVEGDGVTRTLPTIIIGMVTLAGWVPTYRPSSKETLSRKNPDESPAESMASA